MIAISVNDLSLSYGTTPILEKVSFSLEENDKLGIIGVNGSGKSTLFRLILGIPHAPCDQKYERDTDDDQTFFVNTFNLHDQKSFFINGYFCFLGGTGSHPPLQKGWQRKSRLTARTEPFRTP